MSPQVTIDWIQKRRALGFKVFMHAFDRMIEVNKSWSHGFTQNIAVIISRGRPKSSMGFPKIRKNEDESLKMKSQRPSEHVKGYASCSSMTTHVIIADPVRPMQKDKDDSLSTYSGELIILV